MALIILGALWDVLSTLFKVIKLVGYQPNRDKLVDIPLSHVIFLKARRTNNKLISIN